MHNFAIAKNNRFCRIIACPLRSFHVRPAGSYPVVRNQPTRTCEGNKGGIRPSKHQHNNTSVHWMDGCRTRAVFSTQAPLVGACFWYNEIRFCRCRRVLSYITAEMLGANKESYNHTKKSLLQSGLFCKQILIYVGFFFDLL